MAPTSTVIYVMVMFGFVAKNLASVTPYGPTMVACVLTVISLVTKLTRVMLDSGVVAMSSSPVRTMCPVMLRRIAIATVTGIRMMCVT